LYCPGGSLLNDGLDYLGERFTAAFQTVTENIGNLFKLINIAIDLQSTVSVGY
jgi:hypothetical protein